MTFTKVTTEGIADSAVSTAKIGANAVDTTKIGADVIVADDIADNAITVAQISDGAVSNVKIADDAISTAKIADLGVTHAKLHNTMDLSSKTVTLPALSTLNVTNNGAQHTNIDIFNNNGSSSARGQLRVGYDASNCLEIFRVGNSANITYNSTQGGGHYFKQQGNEKLTLNADGLLYLDSQTGGNTENRWQVVSGSLTAASSGSGKKAVRCGHTFAGTVHVIAKQAYGAGSAAAIFTASVSYGSPSVSRRNMNHSQTITDLNMSYDNGGSPNYTFNINVTYSGSAPTLFVTVQGMSAYNMYVF